VGGEVCGRCLRWSINVDLTGLPGGLNEIVIDGTWQAQDLGQERADSRLSRTRTIVRFSRIFIYASSVKPMLSCRKWSQTTCLFEPAVPISTTYYV
jgi:hypothetical protein